MDESPQAEPPLLPAMPPIEAGAIAPEVPPSRPYCVFRAGSESLCLAMEDIEEIVEWPRLTAVPLAPLFLLGIFNLRGAIVPVIEIVLAEGRAADLPAKRVLVARVPGADGSSNMLVGIAADEVVGTYASPDPLLYETGAPGLPHCCGMINYPDPAAPECSPAGSALVLDVRRLAESFEVQAI